MPLRQISVRTTKPLEFVDITDAVAHEVQASGVDEGIVLLRSRHTLSRKYRHDSEGAENAIAHLSVMTLFGDSTWAAIRDSKLDLGTWQRLFLVELFEPRTRTVDLAVLAS
jgi:thiamine phosphate synthase YjbQ (UPF0047 family)